MRPFLILLFMLGTAHASGAELIERIVAIVNDDIITLTDITRFEEKLRQGSLVDEILIPDEATKNALLKNKSALIQKMIEERVIDSEVKRQELTVPIEKVESEIRSIAKRNNVTRDELKSALQERGINFSNYQDFIKSGLERQALIERSITSRIKISEDDVLDAYAKKFDAELDQAFEYTLSHIVFQSEKGGLEAAKTRAEQAYRRLKGGANFEKLASEVSEDPAFEPGGSLGVFKTGELQKALEGAIQKLNAGEFTNVLPSRDGFHIVKVNKKRLIADPRTEKEREKIRAQLYETAYKKQFKSWLEQLRQDAFVRINP